MTEGAQPQFASRLTLWIFHMIRHILRKPETRSWCREFQHNCPELWWYYQQLKTWSFAFKGRNTVPALATTNTALSHKRLCLDCNKTSTYFVWVALFTLLNSTRSQQLLGKNQCAWHGGWNKPAGQTVYWRLFGRYLVHGGRGLSSKSADSDLKHLATIVLSTAISDFMLCVSKQKRAYTDAAAFCHFLKLLLTILFKKS